MANIFTNCHKLTPSLFKQYLHDSEIKK